MRLTTLIYGLTLSFMVAASSFGQHADLRPRVENGQIVTDAFVDSDGTTTADVRTLGYDFQEDPMDPYFAGDPGFNAVSGSGLPAGLLNFNILSGSRFDLPANLVYWDGTGAVNFGAVPTGETFRFNRSSNNLTFGPLTPSDLSGFAVGTVSGTGSVHTHLSSFLNGSDGNATAGDGFEAAPGIYLFAMELVHSDSSIAKSEPLFMVFNNGLLEDIHDEAIDWVVTNLEPVPVPEPSTIALCVSGGLVGLIALARRRRLGVA